MGAQVTDCVDKELSFLSGAFSAVIRDPLWKDIYLTDGLKALTRTRAMQKLNRIKQLGPVFLLYPGAVHTRFNHSVGVYHLARLLLISLLKEFREKPKRSFPFTRVGILSFLSAALLHDIGHFPYTHALKELSLESHEALGAKYIDHDEQLQQVLTTEVGANPSFVSAIIDESRPCPSAEVALYRTILSGSLDPDKLDYLNRDAFFCGVPYGSQDVDYITGKIVLLADNRVGLPWEAIDSLEHLLFSKYLMYKNVYWHKRTRSATAMAKKALFLALQTQRIAHNDLYDLDDELFAALVKEQSAFPPFRLIDNLFAHQLLEERFVQPFSAKKPLMVQALDLVSRTEIETRLYRQLQPSYRQLQEHQVIIDIPEEISFETDLPIILPSGEICSFATTEHLFSAATLSSFTASLRTFRIFVPAEVEEHHLREAYLKIEREVKDG